MSLARRLAIGFPLARSHPRRYRLDSIANPGGGAYFIEWDPGGGTYGEDWTAAPRDRQGVLLTGARRHYHPIRIAQFALHRFGVWLSTGNAVARDDVIAQAAWLRDGQQPDGVGGSYRFEFAWTKYGAGAGWSSAMAQGEAISVLLRAERLEPGAGFADAAVRAAAPFRTEIDRGGVLWASGDDVFFEEIANRHAPHVLNGCIFALWGLWELSQLGHERWLDESVQRCVQTLIRWLPRFDTGWWTLYSLMRSAAGRPHLATLKYHEFHVAQMRVLSEMFGEPAFTDAAQRWASYTQTRRSWARLLHATLGSLPERFLGHDTVLGGART